MGPQMRGTTARKHLSNFILDIDTGCVFFRSSKVNKQHRRVMSKEELVAEIQKNHAVYETTRKTYFPVTRENVRLLFKQTVKCGNVWPRLTCWKRREPEDPFLLLIQTVSRPFCEPLDFSVTHLRTLANAVNPWTFACHTIGLWRRPSDFGVTVGQTWYWCENSMRHLSF